MSGLHVSLLYQSKPCTFDLVADQGSEHSVEINGVKYAVIADKDNLNAAEEILGSLPLSSLSSPTELGGRLSKLPEAAKVSVTFSTHEVASRILGTGKSEHKWQQKDEDNLSKRREKLAELYWEIKVKEEKADHTEVKKFLGNEEAFEKAVQEDDFPLFASLFNDLSYEQFLTLHHQTLGYITLGYVKTEPYSITPQDLHNLRQYLDDIGFSGVVTLSDATSTYCVCPTKQEHLENAPFCMQSIGKTLTGALVLTTLAEEDLTKPLLINSEVLKELEAENKPVYDRIGNPDVTLLHAMTHRGGFGDFLGNYQKAIKDGNPASITETKDFLTFAESRLYPLGEEHYSNLGILLVALHLENAHQKPFDQILQHEILAPANISMAAKKPEEAKFSPEDPCQGKAVGGPAGGHWITSQDLHKFGVWLHNKCQDKDSSFMPAVEKYGTEFFVPEDQEIRHNGNSYSGSAMLSSFLQSGITISILSDQSNFKANQVYYAIRENLVESS